MASEDAPAADGRILHRRPVNAADSNFLEKLCDRYTRFDNRSAVNISVSQLRVILREFHASDAHTSRATGNAERETASAEAWPETWPDGSVAAMTAPAAVDIAPKAKNSRGISRGAILLLGVVVIPFALSAALNSYGALTTDGALRMAFATVAGQTIAIISAIVAVALTVRRRYAWPAIVAFVLIAAVITSWAVGNMASAGDLLLDRLELIAEVDKLNP